MSSESKSGDENLAKFYYELGLKAIEARDFTDALIYFSKAFSEAPESIYGELAYLYYGKAYAHYSYELSRKEGVLASIGYLNKYTFYYKNPKFLTLQREFVGDGYLLIGWFEDARNLYSEVYGAQKDIRSLLKYAYASALLGDATVIKILREIENPPKEFLYLKLLSLGIVEAQLGNFNASLDYLKKAQEEDTSLSYDLHFNFYTGLSYKKLGKIRDSMFYLERARRLDKLGVYTHRLNYHLLEVYLRLMDYRSAYELYGEIKKELAYNPFYQVAYLRLWLFPDFMEKYKEEFKHYYELARQLFWWKLGSPISQYALLALLNKSLKDKKVDQETQVILQLKTFNKTEFVLDNELFNYDEELRRLNEELQKSNPYLEEEVNFLIELYSLNEKSFLNAFGEDKSLEILTRALVYKGDERSLKFLDSIRNASLRDFLKAKYLFAYGDFKTAETLLKNSLKGLEGIDNLEAQLLLYYIQKNPQLGDVVELARKYKEMEGYFPVIYRVAGEIYYERGNYEKAKEFYERFLNESKEKDLLYWTTLVKLGIIAEKKKDENLRNFVISQGKEAENPWRDVILSLWGE